MWIRSVHSLRVEFDDISQKSVYAAHMLHACNPIGPKVYHMQFQITQCCKHPKSTVYISILFIAYLLIANSSVSILFIAYLLIANSSVSILFIAYLLIANSFISYCSLTPPTQTPK